MDNGKDKLIAELELRIEELTDSAPHVMQTMAPLLTGMIAGFSAFWLISMVAG